MTEQPKMTLPNGDVLFEGEWGLAPASDYKIALKE